MKIAAADAIAKLAREDVPDEVNKAYSGQNSLWKRLYNSCTFDPRLISRVSLQLQKLH